MWYKSSDFLTKGKTEKLFNQTWRSISYVFFGKDHNIKNYGEGGGKNKKIYILQTKFNKKKYTALENESEKNILYADMAEINDFV